MVGRWKREGGRTDVCVEPAEDGADGGVSVDARVVAGGDEYSVFWVLSSRNAGQSQLML